MKAYMISLNDSTEKIKYLNGFDIDVILVKGVNAKKTHPKYFSNRVSKFYSVFGPLSAIGCGISHMNTWKLFLESNEEYAIIFEDDVILEPDFNDKLEVALKEIPKDYDILYLGCMGCDNNQKVNILKGLSNIQFLFKIPEHKQITDNIAIPSIAYAIHGYVVSRKGAKLLLKYLDGKLNNHIDICIQNLVIDKKIKSYMVTPRIAYQTSTNNNISANISSNYPLLPNMFLSNINLDKYYKAHYLFNASYIRLGKFNVNLFTICFLVIGFLCAIKNVDIKKVTIIFIILSFPDILKNDIEIILFNYCFLIFPFFFIKIAFNK